MQQYAITDLLKGLTLVVPVTRVAMVLSEEWFPHGALAQYEAARLQVALMEENEAEIQQCSEFLNIVVVPA
jgi:hypothetical protein